MSNAFLYVRTIRHADHTVFCVQEGQKAYYNRQFSTQVPYSSGQQSKRAILDSFCDNLAIPQAPITFNFTVEAGKKGESQLSNGEPWSPCDPAYADQLIGGWMRAKAGESVPLKRRSPLSISALRPLHPLLAGISKENATFDRSSRPDQHPVRVTAPDGHQMTDEEIGDFLSKSQRTLPRRTWIPDLARADGLFVHDIAIDKRTLFSVSLNQHEPEITIETADKLRKLGWIESRNVFGSSLVAPAEERQRIIRALAASIINWRITTNQSRTFSTLEVLAVGMSHSANALPNAIRARLVEDSERPRAEPIVDSAITGVRLFIAPACDGYIRGVSGSADALSKAEEAIARDLQEFDYERQDVPAAA